MTERTYIALVKDPETKDTIVFGVRASTPAEVKPLISSFYQAKDWGKPGEMRISAFRASATDPVLFVGHALAIYQKQEEEIRSLCQKLLEVADGEEVTASRDALYEFVGSYKIGKQLQEESI